MQRFFTGFVSNGILKLTNRVEFFKQLEYFHGDIILIIKSARKGRSTPQNSYYWGVVLHKLGNHFGYTKDEMHKALKVKFDIHKTSKLDVDEFGDYLNKILTWAAIEHRVNIPDPS